jgi:DDE_Tnp_1-associated/Transposase DDE domain
MSLPVGCRPLVEVLREVEDPRAARGQRYSLVSLLTLCCAGLLCGCRTYSAVAQWGRDCDRDLGRALGFVVRTPSGVERSPCASTLFYALRDIARQDLECQLAAWAQEVLAALPPLAGEAEALAIDGKTLRGSAKIQAAAKREPASADEAAEEVPGVHLLSAFSHRLGFTLHQRAVASKSNEITAMPELLQGLLLEGRVITVDALLTQRSLAADIVKKGGTT